MPNEVEDQLSEVLSDVRMPLENITFALDQYLCQRNRQLDAETRALLSGVRRALDQVASTTRRITEKPPMASRVGPRTTSSNTNALAN